MSKFRVRVEQGPKPGQKYKIKTDTLIIGSDPGVDIVIQARGVAPRHAQVIFDGGQLRLEDLGTQEGTFRNGQRLLGPVQLFPGDRIGLGPEVVLTLDGDDSNMVKGEEKGLEDDPGIVPEEAS